MFCIFTMNSMVLGDPWSADWPWLYHQRFPFSLGTWPWDLLMAEMEGEGTANHEMWRPEVQATHRVNRCLPLEQWRPSVVPSSVVRTPSRSGTVSQCCGKLTTSLVPHWFHAGVYISTNRSQNVHQPSSISVKCTAVFISRSMENSRYLRGISEPQKSCGRQEFSQGPGGLGFGGSMMSRFDNLAEARLSEPKPQVWGSVVDVVVEINYRVCRNDYSYKYYRWTWRISLKGNFFWADHLELRFVLISLLTNEAHWNANDKWQYGFFNSSHYPFYIYLIKYDNYDIYIWLSIQRSL